MLLDGRYTIDSIVKIACSLCKKVKSLKLFRYAVGSNFTTLRETGGMIRVRIYRRVMFADPADILNKYQPVLSTLWYSFSV